MGKYLHYYTSKADFEEDYNGNGPVTAFTIDPGKAYAFTCCSAGAGQDNTTTPFDGKKFVFDRKIESAELTRCNGESETVKMMVFKNGDDEVFSIYIDIEGAPIHGWSHENGFVFYWQDLSETDKAGDYELGITSLERGEAPYHEPWVSYIQEPRKTISGQFVRGSGVNAIQGNIEITSFGTKPIGFYMVHTA
jgi:hypothetical protein